MIYRGTYDDDHAWSRFLTLLHKHSQVQLLQSSLLRSELDYVIQDKKEIYDPASKAVVRKHFRRWIMDMHPSQDIRASDFKRHPVPREPAISGIGQKWERHDFGSYPRWRYCVHVDKQALASVLDNKSWVRDMEQDWMAPQTTTDQQASSACETTTHHIGNLCASNNIPHLNMVDSLKAGEGEFLKHWDD